MLPFSTIYDTSEYSSGSEYDPMIMLISFLIAVAVYAFQCHMFGIIFEKAGEPSWKAWVPIYSTAIVFKIADLSPWLVFLIIVPFVGFLALVFAVHNINLKLGRGAGMTVLYFFLPFVWLITTAFGGDRYNRAKRV